MPNVVNGCGTWYYGKKNLQQYTGVCGSCHRQATLRTYDTRLYFVMLMVPLIPLRRKHIIEQCSACKRHGVMPMPAWHKAQQDAQQAIANYRAKPADPDAARAALQAIGPYRDLPAFTELAPEIEKNLSRDTRTLCALGLLWDSFGRADQAERLFRATMALDNSDDIREAVADCLVRQGKPDEAEPLLRHIVEKGIPDRVDRLYKLAQEYQKQGQHDKALKVFAQCELVNPTLTQNQSFTKLQEASAERLGSNQAVDPGKFLRKEKAKATRTKLYKIAPIVLLLAVIAYAALSWIEGMRAPVYLVSGLRRTYNVELDGKRYELGPMAVIPLRLPEGNVNVRIVDVAQSLPAETVTIHSPFWTRPFSNHVFVLNPDQTAVISDTSIAYVTGDPNSAPEPQSTYATGQTVHYFDPVDYPFEAEPKSVEMDSHKNLVTKQILTLMGKNMRVSPDMLLAALTEKLGDDVVRKIAERHLLLEPEQQVYLRTLRDVTKPSETADFLHAGLSRRPINLPWHRAYQAAMIDLGQDEQIDGEYQAMLGKEPANTDLIYLAGRASRDADHAIALYQEAIAANPPCPYAFFSLCAYDLSNARFHEAAENAILARKLLPDDVEIKWSCHQCLLADGQIDKLLTVLADEENGEVSVMQSACLDEIYVHHLQNKPDEAAAAMKRMTDRLTALDATYSAERAKYAAAMQAYCDGNIELFAATLANSSDAFERLTAMITHSDLKSADMLATARPAHYWHGLAYLAAMKQHQTDIADSELKQTIEALSKGNYEARAIAAALQGKPAVPLAELLRSRQTAREKVIMLTMLGVHDPAMREPCFALARKLNFDKRFPHLLLSAFLDTPPAPQ